MPAPQNGHLVCIQKVYRTGYPSGVKDKEWVFVAPYTAIVFNGLHCTVKTGEQWRMMLSDLPSWPIVYQ